MGGDGKTGEEEKQSSQTMASDLNDYAIIKEGEAEIIMQAKNEVFYNKTQVNNRDISIAVLRTFISKRKQEHESMLSRRTRTAQKVSIENTSEPEAPIDSVVDNEKPNGECEESEEISHDEPCSISKGPVKTPDWKIRGELKPPRVLEALSASGLRALRYAREIEGIGQVVALDNDKASVEACRRNIKFNGSVACSKVESHLDDARVYMLTHPKEFDASHANRYKRYIVPVLSVQMDFYVRVFVRIYTSASAMKNTPLKLSYVYQCNGCDSFHLQSIGRTVSKNNSIRYLPGYGPVVPQECRDCGKKYNMGGPIWSAAIHDQEWVTSMLADVKSMEDRYPAYDRISAVLTTVSEELPDAPLFLSLHNLCATLKCTSPSAVIFRSAVINAGYRISGTHVNPLGLKSDAPMDVIWDIMRCWVKIHPVKVQPPEQAGSVILAKEPVLQANFARAVASLSKAQAKKVARFLPNPERHWGPKLRAGRQITSKHSSLLGPHAVPSTNNHEEGDDPQAKRKKVEDPISIS
ncbi:tRNA (guanine(26)-N(2))-dimethyltransferase 1 isoform X2 [Cornus florida]|uniref:tRNA (guanine(26)-N(2))-dimethyltransferase 1 isoform X2 n=1 Tax=Cornus florida TaxID=4283 RepID=UPI00289AC8CF|nr:tRNA (guanine(26)-N(2))-dimethyltransferase 1 isoform X2 [Cornus florida]